MERAGAGDAYFAAARTATLIGDVWADLLHAAGVRQLQEALARAAVLDRKDDWHESRATGQIERFRRVAGCREEWAMTASCGGCGVVTHAAVPSLDVQETHAAVLVRLDGLWGEY